MGGKTEMRSSQSINLVLIFLVEKIFNGILWLKNIYDEKWNVFWKLLTFHYLNCKDCALRIFFIFFWQEMLIGILGLQGIQIRTRFQGKIRRIQEMLFSIKRYVKPHIIPILFINMHDTIFNNFKQLPPH